MAKLPRAVTPSDDADDATLRGRARRGTTQRQRGAVADAGAATVAAESPEQSAAVVAEATRDLQRLADETNADDAELEEAPPLPRHARGRRPRRRQYR